MVARLPSSGTSSTAWRCQVPAVSMATGVKNMSELWILGCTVFVGLVGGGKAGCISIIIIVMRDLTVWHQVLWVRCNTAIFPNSTWLVTSRLDPFDVSSASRWACRAVLFDELNTAKIHGLDTSNVSCRVQTWRDEPSGICDICIKLGKCCKCSLCHQFALAST